MKPNEYRGADRRCETLGSDLFHFESIRCRSRRFAPHENMRSRFRRKVPRLARHNSSSSKKLGLIRCSNSLYRQSSPVPIQNSRLTLCSSRLSTTPSLRQACALQTNLYRKSKNVDACSAYVTTPSLGQLNQSPARQRVFGIEFERLIETGLDIAMEKLLITGACPECNRLFSALACPDNAH